MDKQEIIDLITEIRNRGSELDDVEVKSAHQGTPKRIYESLSALSNRVGGGVILFGFDERLSFATVGVYDVARLQSDLNNLASDEMEPPPRIKFSVEEIEGKSVVAVEVPECPWNQKPCYYKPAGLSAGSYIRVGDGDRRMTEYEIHSYLSCRQQPRDDVEVVHEATLNDLNSELVDEFYTNFIQTLCKILCKLNDGELCLKDGNLTARIQSDETALSFLRIYLARIDARTLDALNAEYPKLDDKIRNLPVPDLTIEEMLQALSRWEGIEKEKESLAEEIQDTDNLIDAKVFRLYGLEREEIITVLDSLGTDEEVKADILEKWEELKNND